MTVRLVKRKQRVASVIASDEKQQHEASPTQLALTTQGWVEEFRAQKARDRQSMRGLMKRG